MKTSPNVSYKESVHIRDVAKKIDPSAENRVLPTKMSGHFRENEPANSSGPETYPWCCYAINYGRYVEEEPSE
jgi:hypothetical protein